MEENYMAVGKNAGSYSFKDIYGEPLPGGMLSTTEQTIPEEEEREEYNEQISENGAGQKTVVDKNVIFGAVALFVTLLVLLNFIE
jgi:hypothetical protein